ncbi:hypothetical protein OAQ99_06070 [Candidatus Kapabacteria bacterium]|nr:hypothetical protein [Candidatus Kapabacteria bacterium]
MKKLIISFLAFITVLCAKTDSTKYIELKGFGMVQARKATFLRRKGDAHQILINHLTQNNLGLMINLNVFPKYLRSSGLGFGLSYVKNSYSYNYGFHAILQDLAIPIKIGFIYNKLDNGFLNEYEYYSRYDIDMSRYELGFYTQLDYDFRVLNNLSISSFMRGSLLFSSIENDAGWCLACTYLTRELEPSVSLEAGVGISLIY